MSHGFERFRPVWSNAGAQFPPATIAGLPACSAIDRVGPPLSAGRATSGSADVIELASPPTQLPSLSRSWSPPVTGAAQSRGRLSATIVSVAVNGAPARPPAADDAPVLKAIVSRVSVTVP